jgi:phosphate transport system substrate-binding protein
MNKKTLVINLIALFFLWGTSVQAEPLEVPGTGAAETVLKALASEFNRLNPEHRVIVPPSVGSSGGIKAVINNEALLARVARPLKPQEAEAGISYLEFAKDAVVFAVGSRVTVDDLTVTQLTDIFSGKVTRWNQVGGDSAPIRLLVRESTETSFQIIKQHLTPFKTLSLSPRAKLANRDYETIELLDKYSTAIGWTTQSTLASAKTTLTGLGINGVKPTLHNVQSGDYALTASYAVVYKPKRFNALGRLFIDFIFSNVGKQILAVEGVAFVPKR